MILEAMNTMENNDFYESGKLYHVFCFPPRYLLSLHKPLHPENPPVL
jgi:hypothetical protein